MAEYTSLRLGILTGGCCIAVAGFFEFRKKNRIVGVSLFILGVFLSILSGTIL